MRSFRMMVLIVGCCASLGFAEDEAPVEPAEETPAQPEPPPAPVKWTFCRYHTHAGTQQQSYCTQLAPSAAQQECEAKVGAALKTTVACACTDDADFIGAECGKP